MISSVFKEYIQVQHCTKTFLFKKFQRVVAVKYMTDSMTAYQFQLWESMYLQSFFCYMVPHFILIHTCITFIYILCHVYIENISIIRGSVFLDEHRSVHKSPILMYEVMNTCVVIQYSIYFIFLCTGLFHCILIRL